MVSGTGGTESLKKRPLELDVSRTPLITFADPIIGHCPVWTYMDAALLQRLIFGWIGFTVADVYPASVCGQKYHRREPRWISACFLLIGSKTSTFALPVHTSGLRSYGMCRLTIPCQVAAILSGVSSCFCLVVSFPQAVCGAIGPRYSSFLDKIAPRADMQKLLQLGCLSG